MNLQCTVMGIFLVCFCAVSVHGFGIRGAEVLPSSRTIRMSSTLERGLPKSLRKIVDALRTVSDDKLRYQQLLFLATQAKNMPDCHKIPENKVPGCLSTVYVHAQLDESGLVQYVADSDSQLTKGLVTMLVDGLSGNSIDDIQAVEPEFIKEAGIAQSLTPGRNNGFLNMLRVMKKKASELRVSTPVSTPQNDSPNRGPIYSSIQAKLQMLKPIKLIVIDESHKHAGHAGVGEGAGSETHFAVQVVADCFEGLSLVQRHKLIYTLLATEMNGGVHALSISAKAPKEL